MSHHYVDLKFIHILGGRLLKFHEAGTNTWAFRCPICGDSKRSQNKTRGNIYEREGNFLFHCHNCNQTMGLANFIDVVDSRLHNEYVMERFFSGPRKEQKDEL